MLDSFEMVVNGLIVMVNWMKDVLLNQLVREVNLVINTLLDQVPDWLWDLMSWRSGLADRNPRMEYREPAGC